MVAGDSMLVRAATDVPPGEQLTITYIGPRVMEPLEERRMYLKASADPTTRHEPKIKRCCQSYASYAHS